MKNNTHSMNSAAAAKYTNGHDDPPILGTMDDLDNVVPLRPEEKLSFWQQRLVDLRLKTMHKTPTPWNATMVTTWCAVITLILVLVGFLVAGAFYMGVEHNKRENMEQRLKVAEDNYQKGLIFEASKTSQIGHEQPQQEKK